MRAMSSCCRRFRSRYPYILLLVLLLGALPFGVFLYLRTHGFSAREKPSALEAIIARKVRYLATPSAARSMVNPVGSSELALAEARDHFADHCATCHGNDGSGRTLINSGLYPPAPDLREEETQGLTDGELFFIVKNGIRFTGMPGFGGEAEANWKLVLFLRHLPQLSPKERALMAEINDLT